MLTGSATVPGIATVQLIATNSSGDSLPQLFTIGIEEGATTVDANADVVWDLGTDQIIVQSGSTLNTTPVTRGTPQLFVKEGDDFIMRLRLVKNGTPILLDTTVTGCSLKLNLKEFETDPPILTTTNDDWSQTGTNPATDGYLLHVGFTGSPLAGALSNYEKDQGTFFVALAEFEFIYNNPLTPIGPALAKRICNTFFIQIERDLAGVS